MSGEVPIARVGTDGAVEAPTDHLLKFTPPLDTVLGVRWNDLLLVEMLCAQTLAAFGIPSVAQSLHSYQTLPGGGRAGRLLRRFDREGLLGRRGAATLYDLAVSRNEFELSAPDVRRSLAKDGLVREEDASMVERVHAFSAAIGNTDAHLGNYGLRFDESGRAALAPIYDVTAMVFAPVADELPDERVTPRSAPIPPAVEPMVAHLVTSVREEPRLSPAFRDRWLRYVGA